jgi:thiamine-phosphate pyrophosphorylase
MSAKIYLISPPEFDLDSFSVQLEKALATKKVPVFQLRVKNLDDAKIISVGKTLLKICRKYQTSFILNDRFDLALKIGADGVHIGSEDGIVAEIRKKAPQNFIIGSSCYDSKHRVITAAEEGADYVSLGAFFESKTKKSPGKPDLEILKWCDDFINVPVVAIGGIDASNCDVLVKSGADFLAIISYVWQHPNGVEIAINSLEKAIKNAK